MEEININSKEDYFAAINKITKILNSKDSQDGKLLDKLLELICTYEKEHFDEINKVF